MPTSRPSAISSCEVSPSPTSCSVVWSSAARWMIRSSAARSMRAGRPSLMLLLLRGPSGLQAKLGHQGGDLGCGQGSARRLGSGFGLGCGGGSRRQKRPEELDGYRENGGGVVLRCDLGDRLQIPELKRRRLGCQV